MTYMEPNIIIEYKRLRALGWHSKAALRASKVKARFDYWEAFDRVRLHTVPDEDFSLEDLEGDMFNREANPDIEESRMVREQKAYRDKIEREGVWGLVGQYRDVGKPWKTADSCFGFVGDDWEDSGTDTDIMEATVNALLAEEEERKSLLDTRKDVALWRRHFEMEDHAEMVGLLDRVAMHLERIK